ncbi:MAG: twin-arginine translocase TatA/TatE family subunit [Desulfovibrio sp.]|nr:twin-arginine translocase TatA/TatE family subunit [Desulfovibrio sp.]
MFGIGMQEILVILVIVLLIFGANKLPEIGGGLGRAIRNFRRASSEPDEIDITPKNKTAASPADDGAPKA